jgi:hypothetical protein
MNSRLWLFVAAVGLLLAVGPGVASAQETLSANIPFAFIVDGKANDAGAYTVRVNDNRTEVWLTPSKGPSLVALVITRLAASAPDDSRVVFDKVGNTNYLSEVWLPGADGYLVYAAKEAHTHHVLKTSRKAE